MDQKILNEIWVPSLQLTVLWIKSRIDAVRTYFWELPHPKPQIVKPEVKKQIRPNVANVSSFFVSLRPLGGRKWLAKAGDLYVSRSSSAQMLRFIVIQTLFGELTAMYGVELAK